MNNIINILQRRIAKIPELKTFYEKLVENDCSLELENNIDTRMLVTALQAEMGGLIGDTLSIPNVYPALIMHTTLPSTPLCIIGNDRENLLNQILDEELLQHDNLKNSIINRSYAIEGFLNSGRTFVALYIKDYHSEIMNNLSRLQSQYPNLILKKVDKLPKDLHGSTYLINDERQDKLKLFLASVITTQCNQSLKDSLELTKIFIKSCEDSDFYSRLLALNLTLQEHGISCSKLINLDANKFSDLQSENAASLEKLEESLEIHRN